MADENLSELSAITLPTGTKYKLKDADARAAISAMEKITAGAVQYLGKTATSTTYPSGYENYLLEDGSTTKGVYIPTARTIRGTEVLSGTVFTDLSAGDMFIQGNDEFIWDGTQWNVYGNLNDLGDLAYNNSASVTISNGTLTAALTSDGLTVQGSYKPAGTVGISSTTSLTTTVTTANGVSTYTPGGTLSGALSADTLTVSTEYTPAGSVTLNTQAFTATISTYSDGNYVGNYYTPSGTVGAPTINLASAGATKAIREISGDSVVSSVATYAAGATAPAGSVQYWSVANETLTLNGIYAPTVGTSSLTVKTGDASYNATAPTFTGTSTTLQIDGTVITGATFSGTSTTLSGTATPSGTVSGALSGTAVRLVTNGINVPNGLCFDGTNATISAAGTPSGSISGATSGIGGTYQVDFT